MVTHKTIWSQSVAGYSLSQNMWRSSTVVCATSRQIDCSSWKITSRTLHSVSTARPDLCNRSNCLQENCRQECTLISRSYWGRKTGVKHRPSLHPPNRLWIFGLCQSKRKWARWEGCTIGNGGGRYLQRRTPIRPQHYFSLNAAGY